MSLEAKGISFSYGEHTVLDDISFTAEDGSFTALLGRNGSGKTTLMRVLLGFLRPKSGDVFISGKSLREMGIKERARNIAYIPQQTEMVYSYTVLDAVLMGISPALSIFERPKEKERQMARKTLEELGIGELAGRYINKISGGERQLVMIARAIVQNAGILLLDEPTSSLDYSNQILVLETAKRLCEKGYTVILSTHNPEHALAYASSIIALSSSRIIYNGPAEGLRDGNVLSDLYERPLAVQEIEISGKKRCICVPL